MLVQSAAELLGEAERLTAEAADETAATEETEAGTSTASAATAANGTAATETGAETGDGAGAEADPGTGLEHGQAEQAAAAAAAAGAEEGEEELTPIQTAQHYAMRNLMNAASVMDGQQQYERSEALLSKALEQHYRWVSECRGTDWLGCVEGAVTRGSW